ncbi:hypothetical protein NQZ68_026825 [Dissostichus eleginoides]|nr:hypothetical protein NQZ68_026825 [Dissostichus eleginoides]
MRSLVPGLQDSAGFSTQLVLQLLWRKHAGEPLCQQAVRRQETSTLKKKKKVTLSTQEASSVE